MHILTKVEYSELFRGFTHPKKTLKTDCFPMDFIIAKLFPNLFPINWFTCSLYPEKPLKYSQAFSTCRRGNVYVNLSDWVCESYVVHHLVGTGLDYAPPTCIVHHGAQGRPMSVRSIFMFDIPAGLTRGKLVGNW